jgi:hypothetical protein
MIGQRYPVTTPHVLGTVFTHSGYGGLSGFGRASYGSMAGLRSTISYGTGSTFTSQDLNMAGGGSFGGEGGGGGGGEGVVGAVVGAIADIVSGITGAVGAGQNKKAAVAAAQAAAAGAASSSLQAAQAAKAQQAMADSQARAALYTALAQKASAQAAASQPATDYTPLVVTASILAVAGLGAAVLTRKR